MKYRYILAVALTFSITACKKGYIDLRPKDSNTDATFYKTQSQFKQAVIAIYAPLRDVLLNDYFTSEMHSDNTVYQPAPTNRGTALVHRENISDFTNTSTNSYVNAVWQHCYTGISRANIVIERLKGTDFPEDVKASLDGQAKFLRAWYYFKLVRLYGGVPLFLTEVTSANNAFKPRNTADEVYTQIIADATDAVKELSPVVKFPQTGEATQGAALTLLAEVYLTQKKWADAEAALIRVTNSGYDLYANYADAFLPANKNNKESIFEIQFLEGNVTGTTPNPLALHFLPRTTNTAPVTGISVNNTAIGGWNIPTDDLIAAYEAGDKRLDASIGILEGVLNASNYFTIQSVKSAVNYVVPSGKTYFPYIKKYQHPPLAYVNGSNDNFPLYRYSDALLMLAEAQNEQGKSPVTALNKVRNRAGLPNTSAVGQNDLRRAILKERRVELAFENHRWPDLVRTGQAIPVINAFGIALKKQFTWLTPDSYQLNENKILFPIPQTEVDMDPSQVKQNPGY